MSKSRKIDMVILGLLAHENLTGYDIKKRIDSSISFFWKGSFGSIYPSLSAMEQEGLVCKVSDAPEKQGREKIWYEITDAGREALIMWLQETKATNDLKYETLLKIFFGGVADTSVTLATIEEFERETRETLQIFWLYKANLERVLDNRDHVCYYLTVTFGIETYESYLRWCEKAKALLKKYE
ncbi:MAG: PadR family transcriptional regulator [bacterium]|nr:PadR family transcriptional regulator [bacterium]